MLAAHGFTAADLALLVPHQANLRINEAVGRALGLPPERVVHNIQRYGNTTAASIPLALHEAAAAGRLREGDLVVLAAFGAGLTWGANLLRW
ncbi:MAG: 3-oxoacyl-[acyl-carrier-protein] synthase III C-terminal domain-containing protein [bacterium]